MAHNINISPLTPREAVADALYRAILGLDTNDSKLFGSAWMKNGPTFERDSGVLDGMEAINKDLFMPLSQMDTHHTIGNVRVDIKDDGSTAYMTASALAQHHRRGEGMDPTKKGLLGGTTYLIDLVKDGDDGLWKMKKWVLKINWCDGDLSVVTGG